ncbi:unnamed protein product [Arabidopsis arenosa]|uniref:CCHC-type domain-containing protein n=1 Tax=Arabidopsis arenosa TaxID=38785 RepID=A0A8S2AZF9_ARAAE|nr:unnamed protein product [Arabidopsis arenosa]
MSPSAVKASYWFSATDIDSSLIQDGAYTVPSQEKDSKGTLSMVEDTNNNMAFAFQTGPRNSYPTRENRDKMLCASCGRTGHLAENCLYVRS